MKNYFLEQDNAPRDRVPAIDLKDADALYELSDTRVMPGNIDEAGEYSRRAPALQPDHCEAHVNLGNVLLSQGKPGEAVMHYQRALQIEPNHAAAHSNLGNALFAMSKLEEAAARYQTAIKLNPNLGAAFYNLGNLRMQQEDYDKAVNNYRRAIDLNAAGAELNGIKQQGVFLLRNQHLAQAKALFAHLCRTHPKDVQAWLSLATITGKLGDMDEAGNCCRRILAIQPNHSEAYVVLGHVRFHHRNLDEAFAHYHKALDIDPRNISALNNLGNACQSERQINTYIEFYRRAVELLPDPAAVRGTFGKVIKNLPPETYALWLDRELQACFASSGIDDKPLSRIASRLLRLKYDGHLPIGDGHDLPLLIEKIASDDLFLLFLERAVNTDDAIETLLTKMRRALLIKFCDQAGAGHSGLRVISALAWQCLNNEYVFALDAEEERRVAELRRHIERHAPEIRSPDEKMEDMLLVYGMYDSLYSLSCREHLSGVPRAAWSGNFRLLLEQALINPIEEEKIKQEIVTIGRIGDKTSRLVQSQYEENPYPRWLSLPEQRNSDIGSTVRQLFPHFTPPAFLDGPIRILIAGCGTGRHPMQTASYRDVEITAVDISKSSLAYAIRMARKYGVKNVRFMQADILELANLDERFHIIECVGVLHHMQDPLAGWKVLSGLLIDGGLMSIGLYSELARKPIVAAREFIAHEKIVPSKGNIRKFRERILKHELGDHLYELHHQYDFYSTSECRDLLFHFMEHRFTLPQLNRIVNELDLSFIGFVFDSLKTEKLYRAHFPEDKDMTDLLLWDRFETTYPNTFVNMYKFWCQKHN